MENLELLEKTGLSEKQARVYRALLELGHASVQLISEKANLKRPTCYVILGELEKLGLVSVVPQVGKTLYVAESPERLLADLSKKTELLKRYMPELLVVHNAKKSKPKVHLHQGIEGWKHVYDSILDKSQLRLFGTVDGLNKLYPKWIEDFLGVIKSKGIEVKDIITEGGENPVYAKRAKNVQGYQIRTLPKGMQFLNDTAIVGNRVIFFSFTNTIFAIEIESPDIAESMKNIFDLAWQQATQI